jgi:hypothetical protein
LDSSLLNDAQNAALSWNVESSANTPLTHSKKIVRGAKKIQKKSAQGAA